MNFCRISQSLNEITSLSQLFIKLKFYELYGYPLSEFTNMNYIYVLYHIYKYPTTASSYEIQHSSI